MNDKKITMQHIADLIKVKAKSNNNITDREIEELFLQYIEQEESEKQKNIISVQYISKNTV